MRDLTRWLIIRLMNLSMCHIDNLFHICFAPYFKELTTVRHFAYLRTAIPSVVWSLHSYFYYIYFGV